MDQQSPFQKANRMWIILIFIVLLFGFVLFFNPYSFLDRNQLINNIFFCIFSAFIALFLAIVYIRYSFIHLKKTEYDNALYHLKNEIKDNYKRFKAFPQLIDDEKTKWDKGEIGSWIGKRMSFTNWAPDKHGNFQFKYLPSNAYYNFINKGYILDTECCEIDLMNLSYFYESCMQFSKEWQNNENLIRKFVPKEKYPLFNGCLLVKNEVKELKSMDDAIKFIKCEFYNSYRDKTSLNNGIEFSYQEVMKSLDKCERGLITRFKEWLIKKLCFCLEREKKNKE